MISNSGLGVKGDPPSSVAESKTLFSGLRLLSAAFAPAQRFLEVRQQPNEHFEKPDGHGLA